MFQMVYSLIVPCASNTHSLAYTDRATRIPPADFPSLKTVPICTRKHSPKTPSDIVERIRKKMDVKKGFSSSFDRFDPMSHCPGPFDRPTQRMLSCLYSELETVEIKKGQPDIVELKKGSTHFFCLKRSLNNIFKTCLIRWKQIGLKYFYKGGGIGHEKMYRIPGPPSPLQSLLVYLRQRFLQRLRMSAYANEAPSGDEGGFRWSVTEVIGADEADDRRIKTCDHTTTHSLL